MIACACGGFIEATFIYWVFSGATGISIWAWLKDRSKLKHCKGEYDS